MKQSLSEIAQPTFTPNGDSAWSFMSLDSKLMHYQLITEIKQKIIQAWDTFL